MTVTQQQLDDMSGQVKSLSARAEAAEQKNKALEEEKANILAQRGMNPVGGRSDSDEARALRYFRVSHPKQLLHINVADPRFNGVPLELKALVLGFKATVDTSRFISQMFHGDQQDHIDKNEKLDRAGNCKSILAHPYGREVLAPMLKAFGSTIAGAGDEWVPTAISSTYIPEYELEYALEKYFATENMTTNPYQVSKMTGVTKARKATEGGSMTSNNFGTAVLTFAATKLAEYFEIPEELTEDSAPDVLAAGRSEVGMSQVRGFEAGIISGDNDGTHIDSDTQAGPADVAEKQFNGLRKLALANSANGSTLSFGAAAVTHANMKVLRSRMAKFGVLPSDCVIFAGAVAYLQLVGLDEVTTFEKFGPMATILKGVLAAWDGIPIYTAEQYREDLNASGVYDGTTTDRTSLLIVNKKRFYIGQRRPIKIKVMPSLADSEKWLMASYRRVDFQGHAQSAAEKSVVLGYNIQK